MGELELEDDTAAEAEDAAEVLAQKRHSPFKRVRADPTTLSPSSQDALKYHGQPVRAERHNSLWDHAWHADLASDISIAHSRV